MDSDSENESARAERPNHEQDTEVAPMQVDPMPNGEGNESSSSSDEEDGATNQSNLFAQGNFVPEIYPVNKPPGRGRGRGAGGGRGRGASLRGRGGRGRASASASAGSRGADGAATSEDLGGGLAEKGKIAQPISIREVPPRGNSLLDSRELPDADENYSENERALSEFFRLHPMLTLDATSEKTLTSAAQMIDESSVKVKELEVVGKDHDDAFLRPAKEELGERSCVNGEKCITKWMAAMRFGQNCEQEFVMREFLLPSQARAFKETGALPPTQGKCLLCCRYFTSYVYTLARNDPCFAPSNCVSLQAFGNTIETPDIESEALTHSNEVETENGYKMDVMLYADEKWADTEIARNSVGALAWRPVVRFRSSDYKFVQDPSTSEWSIAQIGMSAKDNKPHTRPDFVQPLSSQA